MQKAQSLRVAKRMKVVCPGNKATMRIHQLITRILRQVEVIRQQKGVGRNLNQLTTLANMGKVKTVYLKELTDAYAQVSSLLSQILKRKRWS